MTNRPPQRPRVDPRVARSCSAVISAAADLLLASGPQAVTIDAVVHKSGVARSTIYRHFATRGDVLAAAVDAVLPPPLEPPEEQGTAVRLERWLQRLAEDLRTGAWAHALPGVLELVNREPELAEHRQSLVARHHAPLRRLLSRAVEDGLLPLDVDLDEACSRLVGPLFYRRLVTGEPLTAEFCQRLVRELLAESASPAR